MSSLAARGIRVENNVVKCLHFNENAWIEKNTLGISRSRLVSKGQQAENLRICNCKIPQKRREGIKMAKLQRSANTVDTLVLEGGRHLKRLIVVFQVHFLGAKNICVWESLEYNKSSIFSGLTPLFFLQIKLCIFHVRQIFGFFMVRHYEFGLALLRLKEQKLLVRQEIAF